MKISRKLQVWPLSYRKKRYRVINNNVEKGKRGAPICFRDIYRKFNPRGSLLGFRSIWGEPKYKSQFSFLNLLAKFSTSEILRTLALFRFTRYILALAYPEILFGGGQIEQRVNLMNYIGVQEMCAIVYQIPIQKAFGWNGICISARPKWNEILGNYVIIFAVNVAKTN